MSPVISVVMPAYNAGQYIAQAIQSIRDQTFRDFELIVINDGSSDATAELVERERSRDSRIRHIYQANAGIVSALNKGLELCQGEFVARMDADDIAVPERFELQIAEFRRDAELILCGSHARQFGARNRLQPMPISDASIRATLPFYVPFIHPTVMYRLTPESSRLRYSEEFRDAEDYAFWVGLSKLGKMRNLNKSLLQYRVHSAQITALRRESQRSAHLRIASRQLQALGIEIPKSQIAAFIFPEDSSLSKPQRLANWIKVQMIVARSIGPSPYLLAKSLTKALIM